MKLDWMKEVDWQEGLTEDLQIVLDVIGEDAVFALLERLAGHHLFISNTPIQKAQRQYVKEFSGRKSTKKLAFEIGVSEKSVQRMLLERDNDKY